jgi:hypothetical protein
MIKILHWNQLQARRKISAQIAHTPLPLVATNLMSRYSTNEIVRGVIIIYPKRIVL